MTIYYFNVPFEPHKDRKSETPFHNSRNYLKVINTLNLIKSSFELHDAWRIKNPDKKRFTWGRKQSTKVKSRLDYWLSSEQLADYIEETDIVPCIKSDHSAITIKLNSVHVNDANLPRNRGYWKKGILENKDKWLEDLGDSENDIIEWEYIKFKIRQFSIQYGKQKAKTMSREEKDLETKCATE